MLAMHVKSSPDLSFHWLNCPSCGTGAMRAVNAEMIPEAAYDAGWRVVLGSPMCGRCGEK